MLDGQGVTAEVVEPDIGATNGVIHVIDRVLGVPQHTIAEKLALDPMMSSVYSLGNQNHFNHLFNNTDEEFTYVVPSNAAWDEINDNMASAYKILFMGAFGYQVTKARKGPSANFAINALCFLLFIDSNHFGTALEDWPELDCGRNGGVDDSRG